MGVGSRNSRNIICASASDHHTCTLSPRWLRAYGLHASADAIDSLLGDALWAASDAWCAQCYFVLWDINSKREMRVRVGCCHNHKLVHHAAPSSHVASQLVPAQQVVLVPERAGGNNRNHPAGRVELKPRGGTNLLPRH